MSRMGEVTSRADSKSFYKLENPSHQGETNTWFTPKFFVEALGVFDLDPCTESFRPHDMAKSSIEHDKGGCGLKTSWHGEVWLNPPYGKETGKWLDKLREHDSGMALVFSRSGVSWFQSHAKSADAIFFLKGRVSFIRKDGTKGHNAGASSCLFVYGQRSLSRIEKAIKFKRLDGVLFKTNKTPEAGEG